MLIVYKIVKMILSNLRKNVSRLLKVYLYFALVNSLIKVCKKVYIVVRARRSWRNIPGEATDPLGMKLAVNVHRLYDFYKDQVLKHPEVPLIRSNFPDPELICNSEESVKWMLKDEFDHITKPLPEDFMVNLLGEFIGPKGIFTMSHGKEVGEAHDIWYKQRKLASLLFTQRNMNDIMYKTFAAKAQILCHLLDKVVEKGEKIDMQEKFYSFTMDSVEKIFFDNEENTLEGKMSKFGRAFDGAQKSMIKYMFKFLPAIVLAEQVLPYPFGKLSASGEGLQNTWLVRLGKYLSHDYNEFIEHAKVLDETVKGMVEKASNDPNLGNRKDLLARFATMKCDDGIQLDKDTLRDIILHLVIAGRDTTASTLTWMFFMISQNPKVEEKLLEEVDEKLNGRVPTPEDVSPKNMPYLNGVLYETLRLYPPVPVDIKVTMKDLHYVDGTFIPKGSRLVFSPYAMGRNPMKYKSPLKVDPTRWIPFNTPSLFDFPVFQAGPRFCLGKDMAQFEAKVLAATLLRQFRFRLVQGESEKITYDTNVTMLLTNGEGNHLWMLPERRQKNV